MERKRMTPEQLEYCSQFERHFHEVLDLQCLGAYITPAQMDDLNAVHASLFGRKVGGAGYGCALCNNELLTSVGRAYREDKALAEIQSARTAEAMTSEQGKRKIKIKAIK